MKKKIITAVLGICLTTTAFGGILTTQAGGLSSILGGAAKIGGIGIVVNKFGPQIDSFLNKLLKQNNLSTEYTTKGSSYYQYWYKRLYRCGSSNWACF